MKVACICRILLIIGRILTGFQLSFRFLVSCLKTGVTFVNLKDAGHFDEKIASLNWRHIWSAKNSPFSSKTNTGISVSWTAFWELNFLISLSKVFALTCEKQKFENLCEDFRMLLMLGWFLYSNIACKAGWLDNLFCRSRSH